MGTCHSTYPDFELSSDQVKDVVWNSLPFVKTKEADFIAALTNRAERLLGDYFDALGSDFMTAITTDPLEWIPLSAVEELIYTEYSEYVYGAIAGKGHDRDSIRSICEKLANYWYGCISEEYKNLLIFTFDDIKPEERALAHGDVFRECVVSLKC